MLRYYVMLIDTNQSPLQNDLRWLLRRGSPLPISNREVKPDCADGTAVMWESMSLPFFRKPFIFDEGFFVLNQKRVKLLSRFTVFYRKSCLKRQDFLFLYLTQRDSVLITH